ncbi:MAG: LD-carboxypeptidase [Nanoarchaeota archaeon]|nr:LD-carboxypeptidase [Nanoarchaeota archaeon]
MIKPQPLKKGDTIAFVAPSFGLSALFPHRIERAKSFLESKGFKIKIYPCVNKITEFACAGTAEERVSDIHSAFKDSQVKAIICTIGGLGANELLPLLDYKLIKDNPKIFCGYSDISLLHYAIHKKTGLVTFYGPCAMPEFGEYPEPFGYTYEQFLKSVTGKIGAIEASKEWTDEFLDWAKKEDLKQKRQTNVNQGVKWLKHGKAEGKIMGGCLSSILQLKGTEYDVDYERKILFIEIPEGQDMSHGEPILYVKSQLYDLKNAGIFNKIKGLIVGRAFRYSVEDRQSFDKLLKSVCQDYDFPVLSNFDIGHTDPKVTIPLGVHVSMDSEKNSVSFDEQGVA